MHNPKSTEEFIRLADDAVSEREELRERIAFDEEDTGGAPGFVAPVVKELKALLGKRRDGTHTFADHDLPFMAAVAPIPAHALPCEELRELVTRTCRRGPARDE